jgi:hypothetical protein
VRRTPRILLITALSILGLAAPAAAVSFGSNDGAGSMSVTTWYTNAFAASGSLRAYASGVSVYASGVVVYDFSSDGSCGRFTNNVTSTVSRSASGTCTDGHFGPPQSDGAKIRLCRDQFGIDPCGSYALIRRN